MERSQAISLVAMLLATMICCNIFLLSADFHEECLDALNMEWSDSEDSTKGIGVNQETDEVVIALHDNETFTGGCPYQDWLEDDMADDEANTQGLKCDYDCRVNKFSVVGRCNRQNVCQCCGSGGNGCNLQNGIWYANSSFDESGEPCDDMACDADCVEEQGAAVGACFDGRCECCNFP